MSGFPKPIERVIEALRCFPGVGPKTAQRLAFYLLEAPPKEVRELIGSLEAISQGVRRCAECGSFAEDDSPDELCAICRSSRRDRELLCVVAHAKDVYAFERTGEFRGLYHVLGGLISPMDGRGPENLRISPLMERIQHNKFREIVLATGPTMAGQATALYLESLLEGSLATISRLAMGLPVGSDLETVDEVTLGRALSYRQAMPKAPLSHLEP